MLIHSSNRTKSGSTSPVADGVDENRWKYLQIDKACLQQTKKPLGFPINKNSRGFNGFGQDRLTKKDSLSTVSLVRKAGLEFQVSGTYGTFKTFIRAKRPFGIKYPNISN